MSEKSRIYGPISLLDHGMSSNECSEQYSQFCAFFSHVTLKKFKFFLYVLIPTKATEVSWNFSVT